MLIISSSRTQIAQDLLGRKSGLSAGFVLCGGAYEDRFTLLVFTRVQRCVSRGQSLGRRNARFSDITDNPHFFFLLINTLSVLKIGEKAWTAIFLHFTGLDQKTLGLNPSFPLDEEGESIEGCALSL